MAQQILFFAFLFSVDMRFGCSTQFLNVRFDRYLTLIVNFSPFFYVCVSYHCPTLSTPSPMVQVLGREGFVAGKQLQHLGAEVDFFTIIFDDNIIRYISNPKRCQRNASCLQCLLSS